MTKLASLCLIPLFALASSHLLHQATKTQSSTNKQAATESDLTVHEWGTFTSIAGSNGVALEWRPLLGKSSDLPSFVYGTGRNNAQSGLRFGQLCKICEHQGCGCGDNCKPDAKGNCNCKGCFKGTVRMETPVLYFYTQKKLRISVRVDFPGGKITEWYPKAKRVDTGIDWGTVELQPEYKGSFPREKGKNHYYPARETDAVPVQVCSSTMPVKEHEKFLFYRGVGTFDLPLQAKIAASGLSLENRSQRTVPSVIVFDRRGTEIRVSLHKRLRRGKQLVAMPTQKTSEAKVFQLLEKLLVAEGLYRKEAKAMVETWKDHWFTPGLRVFYLLPTEATDRILPLTITPRPKKIVRVLVGRIEILTQEQKKVIRGLAARLGDSDFSTREKANRALIAQGRFAAPILEEILLDCRDLEVRARIQALLER